MTPTATPTHLFSMYVPMPTLNNAFLERLTIDVMIWQPDRYIKDHVTSAESANLVDPHQRDHWMFGAG